MSILDASYIGKGKTFAKNNSAGTAGRIALGNVSELVLEHEESEIVQKDYTVPGGADRNSISRVDAVNLTLTLTDFNTENLELALRGTASNQASAVVTDESLTVPATLDNDTLLPTASVIDTSIAPVVTSDPAGTTYVDGTDYEVVGAGIVILPGGSISASDPLLVSYTSKAVDKVEGITGSSPEFEIVFSGVNEAQADQPLILTMYRAKFSLPASIGLIADEFGALQLSGKLLSDPTKTGAGVSQYYKTQAA